MHTGFRNRFRKNAAIATVIALLATTLSAGAIFDTTAQAEDTVNIGNISTENLRLNKVENENNNKDYIKGRPLTEKEIKAQKAMEPELTTLYSHEKPIKLENDVTTGLKKGVTAPAAFDARVQSYSSKIRVKDQGNTGLCWAFNCTTAAEISRLHHQTADGRALNHTELSPSHMGYFFYNRVNDPLSNTASDKNVININSNYAMVGGDNLLSLQALATWSGFASEASAPFANAATSYSSSLAYSDAVTLKNAIVHDSVSSAKEALLEHGALIADIYFSQSNMNYSKAAYYCASSSAANNHAITIVGWDDSYSRSNFKTAPSNDGAWIVQNSYGSNWGDRGYFYMSYEDQSISNVVSLEVNEPQTYKYNYQYDGNAYGAYIKAPANCSFGNIYQVKGAAGQNLKAVGITTWNQPNGGSYTIDIYTSQSPMSSPTSGTKQAGFTANTEGSGYNTIEVPSGQNVSLTPGTYYSIVVTPRESTYFGIEANSATNGSIKFIAGLAPGQSFVSTGSGWSDMATKYNGCMRIKGLVGDGPAEPEQPLEGTRVAGSNRYDTALKAADALKAKKGISTFSSVIVACGDDYPDALASGYLAKVKDAPVILVDKAGKMTGTVKSYIAQNLSSGGTVYIVGGTGVVPGSFESSVRGISGATVKRVAGVNRYETNLAILREAGVQSGANILVCSGNGYADALSASAVGEPILLVGNSFTANQLSFMQQTNPGNIYIIGGTGAVNNAVAAKCSSIQSSTRRLSGANRMATSVAVAKTFFGTGVTRAVLAYSDNFPDGLSGGPLAMADRAPILLMKNVGTGDVQQYAASASISSVTVMGGPTLISNNTANLVVK